jgi:hypothetical protein
MSDYDYDDDEPVTPTVSIDAALHLTTPTLDLNAKVGRQTLADLICQQALAKLAKGEPWNSLAKRVQDVTDEEIRAHVTGLLAEALNGDLRRTNSYGEPTGEPTTLRSMIGEEAKKALTRSTDGYNRGETVLQKLVREQVAQAMKTELSEAIKEERAKVVAAVRDKAGQIIAEAITAGIGTGR